MKTLSFKQPWAWALFNGKDVDNRSWGTKFRGRIYIHASKSFDMKGWVWISQNENRLCVQLPYHDDSVFVRGAIIGEVTIVDCVDNHGSLWFFGPYGFVLENPIQYRVPIPQKGMLGFFDI